MLKVIVDSCVFDKLINLSQENIRRICERCELITTNVSLKELSKIEDKEKKDKILNLIKESFKIIDANIFSFARYGESIIEDSAVGFSRYDSPEGGSMLRYKDAPIINKVPSEKNKIRKGSSFNDTAIALAFNKYPDAIFITEEKRLKRLQECGKNVLSFDEFMVKLDI